MEKSAVVFVRMFFGPAHLQSLTPGTLGGYTMNSTPNWAHLLSIINKTQKPKIDSDFEDLLADKINISLGTRTKASDSHNHLRDFLRAENSRDASFPRVLSKADADFLGGSFGRHTKIWPLNDIDLYVPLDGQYLYYLQNGLRLPYSVVSDQVLLCNPLLSPRWMIGAYISSTKLVFEFSKVLARHYPKETDVRPNGNCVTIRMKQGATDNSDGLGYDVVPCFLLKPDDTKEFDFYLIPDGKGGWTRTNPKLDGYICESLQAFHQKIYRKVVKILKYWNDAQLDGAFSSYYIEFALCREFLTRKTNNNPLSSISEGLTIAFDSLQKAYGKGNQTSWIPGAPSIEKPALSLAQEIKLTGARLSSGLAWTYERTSRDAEARVEWASIFGDSL